MRWRGCPGTEGQEARPGLKPLGASRLGLEGEAGSTERGVWKRLHKQLRCLILDPSHSSSRPPLWAQSLLDCANRPALTPVWGQPQS